MPPRSAPFPVPALVTKNDIGFGELTLAQPPITTNVDAPAIAQSVLFIDLCIACPSLIGVGVCPPDPFGLTPGPHDKRKTGTGLTRPAGWSVPERGPRRPTRKLICPNYPACRRIEG